MGEQILVTGGAGFIGSHLVDGLLARGHNVRVFDSLDPQVHGGLAKQGAWPDYCNPGAEYVLGDVRDRAALARALEGVDVVYHEASAVGVGQSMYEVERYTDINTRGTAVLLDILANDAALRGHIRKLIVASSMSIYGEGAYRCAEHGLVFPRLRPAAQLQARDWEVRCPVPLAGGALCGAPLTGVPTDEDKPLHSTSIYAINKKDQEEMCLAIGHAYGLPVVALRYFNVYGPRQALSNPYTGVAAIFAGRLLNRHRPVIFEDGRQSRDFLHVSDIVQSNLLVLDEPRADFGSFNVGTGIATSVRDVAEALDEHLGYGIEPEIVQQFRAGDIRHCVADISRIAALGYRPTMRFADGVAELTEWVREQTAVDAVDQARAELERRGLTS
jgi:dTDP-L-rhamnose 4-epimerase